MRTVRSSVRHDGQSLAELALLLPVLLLLVAGSAQFGFILYTNITVDTAAREGARTAAALPNGSGAYLHGVATAGTTCTVTGGDSSTNPVCNAVSQAHGMLAGAFHVTIAPDMPQGGSYPAPCANSEPEDGYVRVTVTYSTPIFVPLLDSMLATSGSTRTVSATVEMRVEPCALTG